MRRTLSLALGATLFVAPSMGFAQEQSEETEESIEVEVKGTYSFWALNQHGFLLGKDHPLDDAAYIVQNFRLGLKAGNQQVGGVLRLDAAQGWWGVDNNPNTQSITTLDEEGNATTSATYNPYAMFGSKDTNYAVHVDHAFVFFNVPNMPARVQVGRRYQSVGNKLVLDYDYDGVDIRVEPSEALTVTGMWAKVSEGVGSYQAPVGLLMSDEGIRADANLMGATLEYDSPKVDAQLFALYYNDNVVGEAYLPEGLGYVYSRFQPQVTTATALGLAANGVLGSGLKWKFEGDYLMGQDTIDNADYSGNNIDINDGTLKGYNALLDVEKSLDLGKPAFIGLLLGRGSGDADKTSGPGNINRIQTMGFWGLTHVWEDSVMPDISGISPQGLGSPVSRGYRELENTTVVQARVGLATTDWLKLKATYTYLLATQPIQGWDANGPTTQTASDIGQEVDLTATVKIWKQLTYKALFGYFMTGEGAALLINGNTDVMENAWELKQVLAYSF